MFIKSPDRLIEYIMWFLYILYSDLVSRGFFMLEQLTWSKSSISANKTMNDSLDLLFCQNLGCQNKFKDMVLREKSIAGLIKLIKEIW